MYRRYQQKNLIILLLLLGIAGLSVGFAAFSTNLSISSSANVTPDSSNFSIKFSTSESSLKTDTVKPSDNPYNLVVTNGVITNSITPVLSNLSATFTEPGQYVEYSLYIRNDGQYNAYLSSFNFVGDKICTGVAGTTDYLVQSACESINITAKIGGALYTETSEITGYSLEKKTSEQIVIRLEYDAYGAYVDGDFSIDFPNIVLIYTSTSNPEYQPSNPDSKIAKLISGTLEDLGSEVSIGTEEFYVLGNQNNNVVLISKYNLRVGFYHAGEVYIGAVPEPVGIQGSDALGWYHDYIEGDYIIGVTGFSSYSVPEDERSKYEGSIVEGYVNDYKTYLEALGVHPIESRLINQDELERAGCSISTKTCANEQYKWIYNTAFWTQIPSSTSKIYCVSTDAKIKEVSYSSNMGYGVRPVIVLPKSDF